MKKRQLLVKHEMDKRMAELIRFSKSFKVCCASMILSRGCCTKEVLLDSSTSRFRKTLFLFLLRMKRSRNRSRRSLLKMLNLLRPALLVLLLPLRQFLPAILVLLPPRTSLLLILLSLLMPFLTSRSRALPLRRARWAFLRLVNPILTANQEGLVCSSNLSRLSRVREQVLCPLPPALLPRPLHQMLPLPVLLPGQTRTKMLVHFPLPLRTG